MCDVHAKHGSALGDKGAQMNLLRVLSADVFRQAGTVGIVQIAKCFVLRRCFRPIVTLRICQELAASGIGGRFLLPLGKLVHRTSCWIASVDLPWATKIGPGFCITHGWGLVVSPDVTIGSNVTLFHGVTLGRRDYIEKDGRRALGAPTIMDSVWIGPNAIVVGNIVIGDGCRIAGGAFVTQDLQSNSIVVGNPAKVVKRGCLPDVDNPYTADQQDV